MKQDIDLCSLIEKNMPYKMHYFCVSSIPIVAAERFIITDFSENSHELFYQNFTRSIDWPSLS